VATLSSISSLETWKLEFEAHACLTRNEIIQA
jgi:hypothetical protein